MNSNNTNKVKYSKPAYGKLKDKAPVRTTRSGKVIQNDPSQLAAIDSADEDEDGYDESIIEDSSKQSPLKGNRANGNAKSKSNGHE